MRGCIDYDTGSLPGEPMVEPFVRQEKSGGSLLAWCLRGLMKGSCSGRGQARWDQPPLPLLMGEVERKRVRDSGRRGITTHLEPCGYSEGQVLWTAPHFI